MRLEVQGPHREEHVKFREEAGVISVWNTQTGKFYVSNKVGQRVLQLCDGNRSVREIVGSVIQEFSDADRERVAAEVHDFLNMAAEKGLIQFNP